MTATAHAGEPRPVPSVLLIDDRPANLLALEAILEVLPLRLVRASSGKEALRALLLHDFALILVDVQMPEMDGFETAAAIKSRPRTAEIPIIFITAIDRDAAHVFKAYARGAVDYVVKPFDADILRAKVSIFVDLYTRGETIKAQAALLHQREIEALERKTEQLAAEAASRMKDEFLANVSHELRTPLNAILGWARLMRAGNVDPARLSRGLETIERNANIQTELIEDLLDVTRIASGKLRLQRRRIDLVGVVVAAVETLRPSATAKGVELELVHAPAELLISADSGRIQQVVWNLVANAVKFTPRRGKVEVRLARRASALEITVRDDGDGMSPDLLAHVFERFRQGDDRSSRTHQGLGLGLAIALHIVQLHGGRIDVESEGPGKGSTFTVTLPIRLLETNDAEPATFGEIVGGKAAVALPRADGLRVLFVDDEIDARELFTTLFEQCGAVVVACGSVNEAVAGLARAPTDVLISDLGMPDEDGYTLIRRVRELRGGPNPRVPAIAVSGLARAEDRARALAAGYQGYLSKPVQPDELVNLVKSLAQPVADRTLR